MPNPRLIATVIEVADLDRSEKLYREAFGLDLQRSEHDDDDRWIGGNHAAISWYEGAFVHFALSQAKGTESIRSAQFAFSVDDLAAAHARAVAAGASLIHAPVGQPWGRSARDPDHNANVIERTGLPA